MILGGRFDWMAEKIVVRGGGDIATGVVQKFHRAGFNVLILEIPEPTAIRRSVALSEAAYDGVATVEDILCRNVMDVDQLGGCWKAREVPLLLDPLGDAICEVKPSAVIDAILAKRNMGTNKEMAKITIALGPGFCAGKDVHVVIETMRGHDLGRLILRGNAKPDTGTPGEIDGKSAERVLRSPIAGTVTAVKQIGEVVQQGEIIFSVGGQAVYATFTGLVRGMIRDGMEVVQGMKIADIDPRTDIDVGTISDKARCIGGAALEAYFYQRNQFGVDQ